MAGVWPRRTDLFKYAAVLSGGIALVLMVPAARSLQEVRELQERQIKDDVSIPLTTLSSGAGELWTTVGEESARGFIKSSNARRTRAQIELLPLPENDASGYVGSVNAH